MATGILPPEVVFEFPREKIPGPYRGSLFVKN